MKSRDFCYWLQGYMELTVSHSGLTAAQLSTVQQHLAMVFKHEIDPGMEPKAELDEIHTPKTQYEPDNNDSFIPSALGPQFRC